MRSWAQGIALIIGIWPAAAPAAPIVNPPQPITHRVTVQLIQTALDNGASPATVFGNSAQRAEIEADIDLIWAQAGIDIAVLPNPVRYDDTFAYQGNSGNGTRPTSDLSVIRNNARNEGGILHPDSLVLNVFFVNVVPGFTPLEENYAAGLASIGSNGIAAFVGDNLLGFANGLDTVAKVIAHEIGHNLGLVHTTGSNLMNTDGNSQKLTSAQITTVFQATSFPRPIPIEVLAGDYNGDGIVNAADYTLWRDTMGQVGTGLAADGNNNGRIDKGDYSVWKANFGAPYGGGGGIPQLVFASPEPATFFLLASGLMLLLLITPRYIRGTGHSADLTT